MFFAYLFLYALASSIPNVHGATQIPLRTGTHGSTLQAQNKLSTDQSLEEWLQAEEVIALQKLLANVAPGGQHTPGAAPGTVIASPSKEHPDYYYQWIRDAAISMGTLVDQYVINSTLNHSASIVRILEDYASFSYQIQRTSNPSGSFQDNLSGLGEPKFHIDGSPFTGNWGRPQRDGPALRAITLMNYLRAYNESHPDLWSERYRTASNPFADLYSASMPVNSTIKADLEYVSHYWQESGFDLWEEVNGLHFFTAIVQWRALTDGAELAGRMGDHGAARWYRAQAGDMRTFLLSFWNEEKGHLIETLDSDRSGLDCGILVGSLLASHDDEMDTPFAPYSDELLVTLLHLVRDNRNRYPINAAPASSEGDVLAGTGIGRYPEDVYDGYGTSIGNPWFLCTSSVAEILYRTATHLNKTSALTVTARGSPFWEALIQSPAGRFKECANTTQGCQFTPAHDIFHTAIDALRAKGDSFLAVVRRHADAEGSLSEQFDRYSGYQRGAVDLTWSYSAFLQAMKARRVAGQV